MIKLPGLIVEPIWLSGQLENSTLRIIDCRFRLQDPSWGEHQYRQGHIPGAYYLHLERDLSNPVNPQHGGRHPLPAASTFAAILRALDIRDPQMPIVIYDDNRQAISARVWWLFRFWGHSAIAFLNGGWSRWQRLGLPTVREPTPSSSSTSFLSTLSPNVGSVINISALRSQLLQPEDSMVLVDARSASRYRGIAEPIDPVPGRIPGSINIFWQDFIDEEHCWHSLDWQSQIWSQHINHHRQKIVVYCGSGVTACVLFFSLKTVGYEQVQLYVGGWSEWCLNNQFVEEI